MEMVERTPVADRPPGVHWFAGRLHEVLDDLTVHGVSVGVLDARSAAETVVELTRAVARLDAESDVVINGNDGGRSRSVSRKDDLEPVG